MSVVRTQTQFTCNDAGDPEAVTANSYCNTITIGESPFAAGYPREYIVRAPLATSPAFDKNGGTQHTFTAQGNDRQFVPGQIVGYVEIRSGQGSTQMNQLEE